MDAWFGLVSSLAGVIVGALATYVSQELLWRRSTRRDLYGTFASKCNAARDSLLLVRYSVKHDQAKPEKKSARWDAAITQIAEVSAQRAYLSLVARDRTSQAAEELERHLRQIQKELHEAEPKPKPEASDQKELKSDLEYRKAYAPFLKEFLSAASKEIGIARRGTDRIAHSLAAFRGTTSGTSDK